MKKQISFEQIESTIDVLMNDIVYASMLNKLIQGIYECIIENERLYKRTGTFWTIAFESIKEARLIRLCRLVDKTNKSISIINILRMLKENRRIFAREEYIKRELDKGENNNVNRNYQELSIEEIEKDMKLFENNDTTSKIRIWRNNYMAHKGFDVTVLKSAPGDIQMDVAEMHEYLGMCKEMINKYSSILFSRSWTDAVFTEDYRNVFKLCTKGMNAFDKELDEMLEEITKTST